MENCICNRPRTIILCRLCGFSAMGRLRKCCGVHPQTMFLFDFGPQCPNKSCRALNSIMELRCMP